MGLHRRQLLPKRAAKDTVKDWLPPKELEGALRSLYRSYEKAYEHWEKDLKPYGETPPVFIVVCPNTVVSKLVYDWIAGEAIVEDGEVIAHKPGNLALFSNIVDGQPVARPRTHPGRLGPARVRRGAQGRLQEGGRARDRQVQGRVPADATPAPTPTSSPTRTCCVRS